MRKVKIVLYWITVLPAVLDALKGAYNGIKKGLEDIKDLNAKSKAAENQRAFDEANCDEHKF